MIRMRPRVWPAAILAMAVLLAVVAWAVALRRDPPEAREARVAIRAGRYDEAEAAVARWLKAEPRTAEAHLLSGRVATGTNRLSKAVEELKRAHALGARYQDLVLLRALIAAPAHDQTPAWTISVKTRSCEAASGSRWR